jgi:predicted Rossmann-fold nucleotide-binding protein
VERATLKRGRLAPYEGHDSNGNPVVVERRVDVTHDASEIIAELTSKYGSFFDVANIGRVTAAQLDEIITASLPQAVLDLIDGVIADARTASGDGKGEPFDYPPNTRDRASQAPFEQGFRRALILSYAHSRDMELLMDGFGRLEQPNQYYGVHDIYELLPAKTVRTRLKQSASWYVDWINSLGDDDQVNVGFFEPRTSAIVYKYGFDKNAFQNGLDGHRLVAHHLGSAPAPIDWVERAINFVYHHLPREHRGILQRPQRPWEFMEDEIAVNHLSRDVTILHEIIRDSADLISRAEAAGLITPWHLLDLSGELHGSADHPLPTPDAPKPIESPRQLVYTMRSRVIEGRVEFDADANQWLMSGNPGWRLGLTNESDPVICQVVFNEPLLEDYSLQVTSMTRGPALLERVQVAGVSTDGFRVYLDTVGEQARGRIGFTFRAAGLAADLCPDDRLISSSNKVEDVEGINNLFRNDAEFGVVTLMASASLNDRATTAKNLAKAEDAVKRLQDDIAALTPRDGFKRARLERALELAVTKAERQKKIATNVRYWDSAKKFGEKWGTYVADPEGQQKRLGGRSIPICTGGGPGIMAAAARGASSVKLGADEARAPVVAIDTLFGDEEKFNIAADPGHFSNIRLRCNDFSIREMALINYAHVILFWPGGFGTCWEVFETLSKLQTRHLRRRRTKAIFVHAEFWEPLLSLVDHFREQGTVNGTDDRILRVTDKVDRSDHGAILRDYIAEVVADEDAAFEVARCHVEYLHGRNELSILI